MTSLEAAIAEAKRNLEFAERVQINVTVSRNAARALIACAEATLATELEKNDATG